ncbi:flavodoxin [Candidatus Enterococcus murrayae]|uniref:Flavodoxin n=1 Tax=Candidatus Enterococcus murrayae TaxID=2815321 RepID=A0ABS3HFQ4_9ENTE|nr:flavodoxin [Enterococcus sp. MJM16]MBO0452281.1 flavodoxin [Enterococcus sp. MJM16]
MTAVVVLFSRAGENYIDGKRQMISVGNTAILGEKISQQLTIPMYELLPLTPYSDNYDEAVQKAEEEKKTSAQVAYEKLSVDLEQVDTIFLGYPNWWGTYPRIIATFLAEHNWQNKAIYPFCTHEGSAFGSSIQDLQAACAGAEIKTGLAVRGSKASRADTAVKNWLLSYSK